MRTVLAALALGAVALAAPPARAQFSALTRSSHGGAPISRDDPVTFQADSVENDRDTGIVTASGHVEAWQNDHVLRADRVTFDRNTNVAAAEGHVVLTEPDGQVLFSDYAELTEGMREAVLRGMGSLLAENGKLAANGARRTRGAVNELSRAVYSTCNVCAQHPDQAPLWQLRARSAVQDTVNKRIEYEDAVLDIYGVPVAWFPYFFNADPSEKRASGFLVPSFGQSKYLGAFLSVPYFWAIDPQQDVVITPTFTTQQTPSLDLDYRRRFNDGTVSINTSIGEIAGRPEGAIFSSGSFAYDNTWRYGFNINRASSSTYLRDYRVQGQSDLLTSQVYIEGFGVGAYTRLDARAYQGLTDSIKNNRLPYALPRYTYSYFGEPDALGGRLRVDTTDFNVLREAGTNTQRATLSLNWDRPFAGYLGEQYTLTLHNDSVGYLAHRLNQSPNFSDIASNQTTRDQPTAALMMRWPFVRSGAATGTQIVEPIVQLVAAPNTGFNQNRLYPNEDSVDAFEFTDATLFSLNRFPGVDRIEGGVRANVALHGNWDFGNGAGLDALVGESFRYHRTNGLPVGSGLENKLSDIVSRVTVTPAPWFDLTARGRNDPRNGNVRLADAIGSAGTPLLRINAGYFYSSVNPYTLYDGPAAPFSTAALTSPGFLTPRNEIGLGFTSQTGPYRLNGFARRNLSSGQMVATGLGGSYENECFIFGAQFYRRYTSINGDSGATTVLFQITLKTVGQFGFHAF